jgi:hypothetical protein
MNTSNTPGKQVIYVDVDDEITTIIDKMNASDAKVIALVLPKRASVFQSVVNMKLMKRRAEAAKKNLVLITSESSLMPLAGMAGLHVAPTLQSRPEVPPASPDHLDDEDEEETASMASEDFDRDQNSATAVGALAGAAATTPSVAKTGVADPAEDVVMFDNTAKDKKPAPDAGSGTSKAVKPVKDKKLAVPNFLRFRKRFLLGGLLLVLLIIGWYVAYFVLPSAVVTIKTNTSDIDAKLAMTLDTSASQVDTSKLIVPAQTKQEQKSNTQQTPATGQENKGEKATGTVNMTANVCGTPSTPPDVPAGTGVSSNGMTFITQKSASLSFDGIGNGCIRFKSSPVTITAQKGGANYNLTAANFTVAGRSDVAASGTTAGGTDNNVKVVQQSDIDAAIQKLSATQDQTAMKRQLQGRLEDDNLYALPSTYSTDTPNVTTSSKVGEEAENVTVTQAVTYTMFGVKKADMDNVIQANIKDKVDASKQSILDNGLSKARFSVEVPGPGPQLKVITSLTAIAGPKIDTEKLKTDIVGLKSGQVKDHIKANPGVQEVTVKYSPFWVAKAPKASKITVQFEKSAAAAGDKGTAGQ